MKKLPNGKMIDNTCQAFVVGEISTKDLNGLFEKDDPPVIVAEDMTMDTLVHALEKFPSKNQARKNGWSGKIPEGWNVWMIGKHFQFVTYKALND